MATAAVFIALGGVGYAATALPANSVGSAQIINGRRHQLMARPTVQRAAITSAGVT